MLERRYFREKFPLSGRPRALDQNLRCGRDNINNFHQRYGKIIEEKRPLRSFPPGHTIKSTENVFPYKKKVVNKNQRIYMLSGKDTPPPLKGRDNMEVQTDLYLEELYEIIETDDIHCQTDELLDRPSTPVFVPAKTGMDAETQILPGELFDFDLEVKPILEVMVGKTMEQALLEVCEEEELASLREQQLQLEEIRAAELLEMQRLVERERRYKEEKERRIAQHKEYQLKRKEVVEKISARAFARAYIQPLVPNVYEELYKRGFFYDEIKRNIAEKFIPWLEEEVCEELELEKNCRSLLDSMILEAALEVEDAYAKLDVSKEDGNAAGIANEVGETALEDGNNEEMEENSHQNQGGTEAGSDEN